MGDFQYRLSRRATIGANYVFTHYSFTGILSSSFIHGASLTYAVRLSRTLEFSGYGGFMHAETKFIQSVPVDPNVSALLGLTSTTALAYHANWVPNFSGRLSKTFSRGVLYVAGGETVTPGNGLFLTSRTASVVGGYGYTAWLGQSVARKLPSAHSRNSQVPVAKNRASGLRICERCSISLAATRRGARFLFL